MSGPFWTKLGLTAFSPGFIKVLGVLENTGGFLLRFQGLKSAWVFNKVLEFMKQFISKQKSTPRTLGLFLFFFFLGSQTFDLEFCCDLCNFGLLLQTI